MLWFRRPAYGKWIAAGALVLVAFAMDVRRGATTPYPFAATMIAGGRALTEDDVRWRRVPVGLLPDADLGGGRASRDIAAGEPLVPGALQGGLDIPDDWWAVPVPLPETIATGATVRLVLLGSTRAIDGIVVQPGGLGTFGVVEAGLVAVPGADAASAASAAARNELTVLIAP